MFKASYNLAVCFAPIMLCGPDPVYDFKISCIVRRLLEAMIIRWKASLAPALGIQDWAFEDLIRIPEAIGDREDPLEECGVVRQSAEAQDNGILLLEDNDEDSGEEVEVKPQLPPRPRQSSRRASPPDELNSVRRKPAPPVTTLPRYSTLTSPTFTSPGDHVNNFHIEDDLDDLDDRHNQHESFGDFDPPAYHTLPSHPKSSPPTSPAHIVPRKPLPKANRDT